MAIEIGMRVDRRGVSVIRDMKQYIEELGDKGEQSGKKTERGFKRSEKAAKDLSGAVKEIRGALATLGAGAALYGLYRIGESLVRPNMMLEQMGVQFRVLLGSADAAQKRIQEMVRAAADTPFQLEEIVRAGRIMESFGIYSDRSLRAVADAAAFAQRPIEEFANYFGRFSAGDFGESLARFRETAVATKQDFEAMGLTFAKSGQLEATSRRAFDVLLQIVESRFGGMAATQMDTLSGMLSNIQDFVWRASAVMGKGLFESVKGVAAELLRVGSELESNGTLERWGRNVGDVIRNNVLPMFQRLTNFVLGDLPAAVLTLGSVLAQLPDVIRAIDWHELGESIGKSLAEGAKKAFPALSGVGNAIRGVASNLTFGLSVGASGTRGTYGGWADGAAAAGPLSPGRSSMAAMPIGTPWSVMGIGALVQLPAKIDPLAEALDKLRKTFDDFRSRRDLFPQWGFRPIGSSATPGQFDDSELGRFADSLAAYVDRAGLGPQGREVRAVRDPNAGRERRTPQSREYNPFSGIGDILDEELGRGFASMFDYAESAWSRTLELFLTGKSEIGDMFEGLWQGFKGAALAAISDVVASLMRVMILKQLIGLGGPIGGYAAIALGKADGGAIAPRGYAGGGSVTMGMGSRADDVLSRLSRDEYVINARAARAIGRPTLDALNNGMAPGSPMSVTFNVGNASEPLKRAIEREIVPALERLARQNRIKLVGAR